jgi:D-amino-acid dehydrogenase
MRVIVIGAGIVGTATAHYLQRGGAAVTVIERLGGPAEGASFANAGSMTASRAGPWASPKTILKTLKGYFNEDSAFKLALRPDAGQLRWLWGFLRSAYGDHGRGKRESMIRLALDSIRERQRIDAEYGLAYGGVRPRLLCIHDTEADAAAAAADLPYLQALGVSVRMVSAEECRALEPAVDWSNVSMAGATLASDDETADCLRFCRALENVNRRLGVDCRYDTEVLEVNAHGLGNCSISTRHGKDIVVVRADAVVVAAGIQSLQIARSVGLRLPMYPVKGYSLTLPMPVCARPQLTIAHDKRKVFVSPMEGGIRAAGVADIVGYEHRVDERRVGLVRRTVRDLYPQADLGSAPPAWTGLRAMTHDGPPIVCGLPGTGLWLNAGHGSLGWTFSLGCARLTTEMVTSNRHEPDDPFLGLSCR